ncbi:MAG: hypothetical protein RR235_09580 [Oscillospiraceae bacterium]
MPLFLLFIFWLGVIIAAFNMAREVRERARSEAADIARKQALGDRLEELRLQGESSAVALVEQLKKEDIDFSRDLRDT